jgi:hypothetical protein
VEKARAETEKARADVEKARAETEKARADVEKTRSEMETARVGIEKTRADIEKTRVDRREAQTRLARQQPQLSIELSISEMVPALGVSADCLYISVSLKNEGELNLEVKFDDSALIMGRIVFDHQRAPKIKEVYRTAPLYLSETAEELEALPSRIFRIGQQRRMVFAIPVSESGVYFVQFSATYYRRPFDGEKNSASGTSVHAIEQALYFKQERIVEAGGDSCSLTVHSD